MRHYQGVTTSWTLYSDVTRTGHVTMLYDGLHGSIASSRAIRIVGLKGYDLPDPMSLILMYIVKG